MTPLNTRRLFFCVGRMCLTHHRVTALSQETNNLDFLHQILLGKKSHDRLCSLLATLDPAEGKSFRDVTYSRRPYQLLAATLHSLSVYKVYRSLQRNTINVFGYSTQPTILLRVLFSQVSEASRKQISTTSLEDGLGNRRGAYLFGKSLPAPKGALQKAVLIPNK